MDSSNLILSSCVIISYEYKENEYKSFFVLYTLETNNMSGFAHQDWKPIVLHKKPLRPQDLQSPRALNQALRQGGQIDTLKKDYAKSAKSALPVPIHKLEDNTREDFHHKTLPSETKMAIINARTAKKWSQDDLARHINEPVRTIKDYESGKAIPHPQILNKMSRVLGIKLKR